jgi:hypothetical protein
MLSSPLNPPPANPFLQIRDTQSGSKSLPAVSILKLSGLPLRNNTQTAKKRGVFSKRAAQQSARDRRGAVHRRWTWRPRRAAAGAIAEPRIARSPPQAGMRPSPDGDAYNLFPYSTGPKGLMRPSSDGDAVQSLPYNTDTTGLMRPYLGGLEVLRSSSLCFWGGRFLSSRRPSF